MPHLTQPLELGARKSLPRRLLRVVVIAAFAVAIFVLGLSVAVVVVTD
jgi:hypothetical protein